jgi:hypothetical protein
MFAVIVDQPDAFFAQGAQSSLIDIDQGGLVAAPNQGRTKNPANSAAADNNNPHNPPPKEVDAGKGK